MRLSIAAGLTAILACGHFCTAATNKNAAFVYLHPAQSGSGRPTEVSPRQVHRILSKHLSVPEAQDDHFAETSVALEAWDWLERSPIMYKGKEVVSTSAAAEKQRTFVLLSGMDQDDVHDVMPASLRNTHIVADAPHPSSFEALADMYGQRIYDNGVAGAANAFAGFFVAAAEGMEHALENAAGWLTGGHARIIDQTNAVADQASRTFYEGLRNFVSFMDALDRSSDSIEQTQAPYHTLRLQGLDEIKATYGQESAEYSRAKDALRDLLKAACEKFDKFDAGKTHSLALIVLPSGGVSVEHEGGESLQKRNRMLFPFRGNVVVTPFLSTRSLDQVDDGEGQDLQDRQSYASVAKSKPKPTQLPKDSDLAAQCFKSASDLNKASQNCTGHGAAVQTSRGGRQCYRCKCQTSKAKGGKLIDWTGQACQRQSIAKPFALLAATTLVLLIVSYASVYFLFYEGSKELPSVLAGISIPSKSR